MAIRVRPLTSSYAQGTSGSLLANDETLRRCIQYVEDNKTVVLDQIAKGEQYTFDYVADESTTQHDIFESIGKSIVTACLQGYNGSIFAYGQTGSGKTYTIQGASSESTKGILPRSFEFLFAEISKFKTRHNHTKTSPGKSTFIEKTNDLATDNIAEVEFEVKCTYVEIYNETIFDLLSTNGSTKL